MSYNYQLYSRAHQSIQGGGPLDLKVRFFVRFVHKCCGIKPTSSVRGTDLFSKWQLFCGKKTIKQPISCYC